MKFNHLLSSIQQTHDALQAQAIAAVNRSLTIRNWLIGFCLVEFEQKGEDRARYGEGLLKTLAQRLTENGYKGFSFTNLNLFRKFYLTYPQIIQTVSELLPPLINHTVSDLLSRNVRETGALNNELQIHQTMPDKLMVPPDKILTRLSFSHITELLPIDDPLKRAFYKIECIKGTWSVRELKRQINSLYFERSGLSQNPEKLSALVAGKAEGMQPTDIIKWVYIL